MPVFAKCNVFISAIQLFYIHAKQNAASDHGLHYLALIYASTGGKIQCICVQRFYDKYGKT